VSIELPTDRRSALKNSLAKEFTPFFTSAAWSSEKIVGGIVNLVIVSEALTGPAIYPKHETPLQRVYTVFRESQLPFRERQSIFLNILVDKIRAGFAANAPSGRFPKGAADVIVSIVNTQLRLSRENISTHKFLQPDAPKVDFSTKEGRLAAIQSYGWGILLVEPKFREDPELTLAALSHSLITAQFFGENLHVSKQFILSAVRTNGLALFFLDDRWKEDFGVVLEAARQNGRAIQFAGPRTRRHICIAKEAVLQDSSAREFLDPSLQGDPEVSLAAVAGLFQKNSLFKGLTGAKTCEKCHPAGRKGD
jgi:hypothetical protein